MPPLKFIKKQDGSCEYYSGDFNSQGMFCGMGTYINKTNEIYYGEFKDDQYNGKGLFITNNGNNIYGNWINDKCVGEGILVIRDKYKYIGNFNNSMKDGEGEEQYIEGTVFKGNFKNGKKSGFGIFKFSNGESYEGQFENDLFNGEGIYTWPEEKRKYTGQFKDNYIHGVGISVYKDGSIYNGHYVLGLKQGQGVFSWPDGKKFYGNWVNNELHGNAYFIFGKEKYEITFRFGKIISSKVQNDQMDKIVLKIENVENINSIKDIYKFICPICNKILNNPQQCKRCLKSYCYNCVNSRNKLMCKNCKGQDYEPNLYLLQELMTIIHVKCDKCGALLDYKTAMNHYHID